MNQTSRSLLRRLGFVLLALSLPGLTLGLIFLFASLTGAADRRHMALIFAFVNLGFACFNAALGLAFIAGGRPGRR